jgi:hypothetical protein
VQPNRQQNLLNHNIEEELKEGGIDLPQRIFNFDDLIRNPEAPLFPIFGEAQREYHLETYKNTLQTRIKTLNEA